MITTIRTTIGFGKRCTKSAREYICIQDSGTSNHVTVDLENMKINEAPLVDQAVVIANGKLIPPPVEKSLIVSLADRQVKQQPQFVSSLIVTRPVYKIR